MTGATVSGFRQRPVGAYRAVAEWLARHALPVSLTAGLGLRLTAIGSRSLQYDDTFSIFLAERSLAEIFAGTAADTMPPLYYFLLHYWMMLGQSDWFIRLLTVLLSLLTVWLVYQLIYILSGPPAAGWAAFLTAVSPLQLYHAQDVRMYALLLAAQTGYALFFVRITFGNSRRTWDWLGLVLCGVAAMYSHNLAIFALAVPSLYLLIKRDWKALLRLAAAQLVIGLLSLPWLLLIPGQIAKVQKAWSLPVPGIIEVLQAIVMFTASLPLPFILLAIVTVLSFQVFIMVTLESWRARRDQPDAVLLLSLYLLVPPAILFAASYIMRPIFIPRGFLISSLAYYGLAGIVIARAWTRGIGPLAAGAFLLAAALSLPSFFIYADFPRSPYRLSVEYLRQAAPQGAVIVHETKLSYFPAHFYDRELNQVFIADPPGSPNDTFELASRQAMQIFPQPDLAAATSGYDDVYFITYAQTFAEYQAMGVEQHPALLWLDERFQQVDHLAFRDLEIYQYRR